MKKKKQIKRKSASKDIAKKTKSFLKKTNEKANEIADILRKQWEKERPEREKLKKAAQKGIGKLR